MGSQNKKNCKKSNWSRNLVFPILFFRKTVFLNSIFKAQYQCRGWPIRVIHLVLSWAILCGYRSISIFKRNPVLVKVGILEQIRFYHYVFQTYGFNREVATFKDRDWPLHTTYITKIFPVVFWKSRPIWKAIFGCVKIIGGSGSSFSWNRVKLLDMFDGIFFSIGPTVSKNGTRNAFL